MLDATLHACNHLAGIALEPAPVRFLGRSAELNNEVVREVLGFNFAALLAPQPKEGSLIVPHNDASVRAPDGLTPFHFTLP
jgi:hypothetical protein